MHAPTSSQSEKVTELLSNGDHGSEVTKLQQMLNQMGYRLDVDGQFGPTTAAAVRHLQRSAGVDEDGVVGPQTLAAITTQSDAHHHAPHGWSHDPSLFPVQHHRDPEDSAGPLSDSSAVGHGPGPEEPPTSNGDHPEAAEPHTNPMESVGAHDDEPPPAEPEEALDTHDEPPHEDDPSAAEDDHGGGYEEEIAPDEYAGHDEVSAHDDTVESSAIEDSSADDYTQDDE